MFNAWMLLTFENLIQFMYNLIYQLSNPTFFSLDCIIQMFNKLKQQNINIKRKRSPAPPINSRSQKKRESSYSAMKRKKQNDSELYDYEIAWICDHLYQGCFHKNKKHGQGVLILTNGVTVIGNWVHGNLNGYALFISPFGGKIHTNYMAGRLEGWVIIQYGNSFEILKFSRDICEPIRRRFDEIEQLWTEAIFDKNGKLQKVLKIQKTQDFSLPSFLTDPQLTKFYDDIIMKGEINLQRKKIKIIKINEKFQYYGYNNNNQIPDGLGVIYSCNQLYAGNFKFGSLDKYGLILFQNGVIYKGQIYAGKIWGNGVIYDINFDQTKSVRVQQEGVQYVLEKQEGCKLDIAPFEFGKIPKMPAQRGFFTGIDQICEEITKYYFRANSSIQYSIQTSEISVKEPSRSNSNSHPQTQHTPYTQLKDRKNILIKQDSSSLKSEKKVSILQKLQSESSKSKSSNQKNFKNPQDSLQFSEQIKMIPVDPAHSIRSKAPSYEQISKQTKEKETKHQYPYLFEFQMSKNVFAPYKLSKIGKIVANSLNIAQRFA